jgi:hypothetical protein
LSKKVGARNLSMQSQEVCRPASVTWAGAIQVGGSGRPRLCFFCKCELLSIKTSTPHHAIVSLLLMIFRPKFRSLAPPFFSLQGRDPRNRGIFHSAALIRSLHTCSAIPPPSKVFLAPRPFYMRLNPLRPPQKVAMRQRFGERATFQVERRPRAEEKE